MTEIIIDNVTKKIKNNVVLENVNIRMKSGKVYGFKGVNGSGKTMLMRVIAGLIRPSNGSVSINGEVLHKDISFPRSLGLLLESPAFLDAYSGEENLKILASIKNAISTERITEVLRAVGLEDARTKKYRKYSLGMKQRLAIAAAIMENPDIIMLDEPTNSLDDDGISIVKRLVAEQRNNGALIIIACHDAEILDELSDEIFCISNGKINNHLLLGDE